MNTIERKVTDILKEIGVPCKLKGYKYIKQAVLLACENEEFYLYGVTKRLYPDIAKLNNTTGSRVERAIRHAIARTFDNIQMDIKYKFFGNVIDNRTGRIKNSYFISAIVERIKYADDASEFSRGNKI